MRYELVQGPQWGQYELISHFQYRPPQIGEVVGYYLTQEDVDLIRANRPTADLIVGQQQPMIVTKVFSGDAVNGRVLIDGPEVLYKQNIVSYMRTVELN